MSYTRRTLFATVTVFGGKVIDTTGMQRFYYVGLACVHWPMPTTSIRIKPESLHKARVAEVTTRKTLGRWLEQAIQEKINREEGKAHVTEAAR